MFHKDKENLLSTKKVANLVKCTASYCSVSEEVTMYIEEAVPKCMKVMYENREVDISTDEEANSSASDDDLSSSDNEQ